MTVIRFFAVLLVLFPLIVGSQDFIIEKPPTRELTVLLNFGGGYPLPTEFVDSLNAGGVTFSAATGGAVTARKLITNKGGDEVLFRIPVDSPRHRLYRYVILEYSSCHVSNRAFDKIDNEIEQGVGLFLYVQKRDTFFNFSPFQTIVLPCPPEPVPAVGPVGLIFLSLMLGLVGLKQKSRRV